MKLVYFYPLAKGLTMNLEFDFEGDDEKPKPTLEALQSYFDEWVDDPSHTALRDASIEVYQDMWAVFSAFCLVKRVWPEQLLPSELQDHLDDRRRPGRPNTDAELSPRYAFRLLRLIDRILVSRMRREIDDPPVTAAAKLLVNVDEYRFANAGEDALPEYLRAGDSRRLVIFLSEVRPRPGRELKAATWKELRNRAAVALQLGAGLTPGEVRLLKLGDPVSIGGPSSGVPWKVRVAASATTAEREAPMAKWAGELLKRWIDVRGLHKIAGDMLFPSTRAGDAWGKESQYKSFKELMRVAQIEIGSGGSFQLRHTFALRQLRKNKSPQDVARWMGLKDMAAMNRYARVVSTPVDVV